MAITYVRAYLSDGSQITGNVTQRRNVAATLQAVHRQAAEAHPGAEVLGTVVFEDCPCRWCHQPIPDLDARGLVLGVCSDCERESYLAALPGGREFLRGWAGA